MPLGYTEENVNKLKINKFQSLADFQAAQNAHLIGDDEISMIEEIMHPDWDQNDPNAPDYIENKPDIPDIPDYTGSDAGMVLKVNASGTGLEWASDDGGDPNVQADWAQTDTTADDYIKNKPNLATVATSGSYNDLTNTPDINAALYEEITYNELVGRIGSDLLIKGKRYRITDYETTVNSIIQNRQNNSARPAGHQFDLVVLATDINKLDCHASAMYHTGESYFNDSNLLKWQIWYDFKNDINTYEWADTTNGKGIIYRMIDEWGNDCPYDFKNIVFNISGRPNYAYTFNKYMNGASTDFSLNGKFCHQNVIKPYFDQSMQILNFNVFYNTLYTDFCYSNTLGENCFNNTFGTNFYCNTLGDGCNNITFGNSSHNFVGGNYYRYNIIEPGNQYIKIYQTQNEGSANYLQNMYVAQGVNDTTTVFSIIAVTRNCSYRTTIGRLSNGNRRVYNEDEADINVKANWNETSSSSPAYIQNKPNLATVATSGSYNDLTDTPDIVQADWAESDSGDGSYIQNKPILVTITSRRWTNS